MIARPHSPYRQILDLRLSNLATAPAYPPDPVLDLAYTIAEAADDRKADDIQILSVGDVSYLADYFVIASGRSKTQVRAIAQSITAATELHQQRLPQRVEGLTDCTWILLDYGDVIVHVLLPKEREYYNLEAFWGHAEVMPFPLAARES